MVVCPRVRLVISEKNNTSWEYSIFDQIVWMKRFLESSDVWKDGQAGEAVPNWRTVTVRYGNMSER